MGSLVERVCLTVRKPLRDLRRGYTKGQLQETWRIAKGDIRDTDIMNARDQDALAYHLLLISSFQGNNPGIVYSLPMPNRTGGNSIHRQPDEVVRQTLQQDARTLLTLWERKLPK